MHSLTIGSILVTRKNIPSTSSTSQQVGQHEKAESARCTGEDSGRNLDETIRLSAYIVDGDYALITSVNMISLRILTTCSLSSYPQANSVNLISDHAVTSPA